MNIGRQSLSLILAGIFCMTAASAETYKCRDSGNKILFSDVPCPIGAKTEKTIAYKPASPVSLQAQSGVASSQSSVTQSDLRYLDEKIDEAIKHDLRLAKQLALTPEHWRKIRAAEENSNKPAVKTNPVLESSVQQPQVQTQQVLIQQIQPQMQTGTSQTQQVQQQLQQQQLQQQQLQQQQLQQQQLQQQQLQQQQQQRQQQRQACLNQLQNRVAASRRAIEGAGTSASSMQGLVAQQAAAEAARCNLL